MASSEGTMLGKYLLLRKLDTGGMGEIFLAKQSGPVGFEKMVVIKRVLAQHLDNQDFVEMFMQEARITARLSHSNIVQVYDFGQIEDSYYTAMEYIHGKGLDNIITRCKKLKKHIHPAHIVQIICGVCSGLSYAHNLKDTTGQPLHIIHRDVNPQNIMVTYDGDIKVIDFGIAKSEVNENKTETGTLKGKFVYMSPEQSCAKKLDKRSDIFPIGICLYQLCGYENPFAKANIVLSLEAIQKEDPPPPSTIDPEYACFDEIVAKALQKEPDNRYGDCREMHDDLQRLMLSGAVKPAPQTLGEFMAELFEADLAKDQERLKEYASIRVPEEAVAPVSGNSGTYNIANAPTIVSSPSSGNIPLNNPMANTMNAMMTNSGPLPIQPNPMAPMPGQPWMGGAPYQPMMPQQTMGGMAPYPMGTFSGVYQEPPKSNKVAIILVVTFILLLGAGGAIVVVKRARDKAMGTVGGGSAITAIKQVKDITPVVESPVAKDNGGAKDNNEAAPNDTKAVKGEVEKKGTDNKVAPQPTKNEDKKDRNVAVAKNDRAKGTTAEPPAAKTPKEEPAPQRVSSGQSSNSNTTKTESHKSDSSKKDSSKNSESASSKKDKDKSSASSADSSSASSSGGNLIASSNPPTRVKIDGVKVGQTPGLRAVLKKATGKIVLGDTQTPYDVIVNYKISGDKITYTISTDPASILTHNGTARGRTPQTVASSGSVDKFEFMDPSTAQKMSVMLRFTPNK